MAERWEYHTTFLYADADRQRVFLQGMWLDLEPQKYAPE